MSYRTVMIFPEFRNMDVIDRLRRAYDPLAALVRPHITLVFPFESAMTNERLSDVLDDRLADISPFRMSLHGVGKESSPYGYFLFLAVADGDRPITAMHDILYANELAAWKPDTVYRPHMTVGRFQDEASLCEAYAEAGSCRDVFTTEVTKVSVEMIGPNEESLIVIEKHLQ